MRKWFLLLTAVIFVSGLMFGCSGNDGAPGANGPAGAPGTPQPVKVLICGSVSEGSLKQMIYFYNQEEFFPFGSTLDFMDIIGTVPTLSYLKGFDAVLLFTDAGLQEPDSVGDVMADYIDAGGGLVVCPYATVTTWHVGGRLMTEGYCPFTVQTPGGDANSTRQINADSIDFPLHPIFNGVQIDNIIFWNNTNIPDPGLDATATLLAKDINDRNAIAINAKGNIIATNIYPQYNAAPAYYNASKVIANSLLYVAKAY